VRTFAFAGNDGYSARAMREQRPLLIPDARADPHIRYDGDIAEVQAICSGIVAPLMLHDRPIGVIALDSTRLNAFGEADLRLLVAFAGMAALAIDHAHLHAETRTLATTDPLTRLANRRAFDVVLEQEVVRAERYQQALGLMVLDIDNFKLYNDTHGHLQGDERLRALARLIRDNLREPDFAARYGGEEFAVILPNTDQAGALALAERLLQRAAAAAPAGLNIVPGVPAPGYTFSLGLAVFPADAGTAEGLLLAADNAELAAKRAGKNRVCAAQTAGTLN
jgi:diguanylate cyclase (GGDEF)-like protein